MTTPKIRDSRRKVSNNSPRGDSKISSIKLPPLVTAASAPLAIPNVIPEAVAAAVFDTIIAILIRMMEASDAPIIISNHSPKF